MPQERLQIKRESDASFTMENCCLNTGGKKKNPALLVVVTRLSDCKLICAYECVKATDTHRLHSHSGRNQVIPHKHCSCPPFLCQYPQYNKKRIKEQSFNCCYLKSSMGFRLPKICRRPKYAANPPGSGLHASIHGFKNVSFYKKNPSFLCMHYY